MAGLGGLASFIQYQGQLQQQEQAKQQQQMQLQMFQQQQQDRQRQQAAQAAFANTVGQLSAPPPPQPPMPGQASQPAPQPAPPPQGGAPLPQGPVPGQGTTPPAGQPPLPPFKPMPTSPPPQQGAPASIGSPPPQNAPQSQVPDQMANGMSLQNIVKSGREQGLSGTDLYEYVKLYEPYMTAQQKAFSDNVQKQIELKKLDAEIQYHATMAQNQQASIAERNRHDESLERLAARRADIAQGNLNVRIETAGVGQGAGGGGAPASGPGKTGANGLPAPVGGGGLSGDAVRMLSSRVKSGDPTAMVGLSRPARAAVQNDLAKLDSNGGADIAGNQIDFAAARKGAQTAVQREANIATSEKAIINPGGLADQVLDAAKKTYRTGSPAMNQKINYVLANYGGDPAVVDLKNALGDLEGQFNKAMAGGGASTDAARAETMSRINDAQTLPQLEAAINRMKLGLRKEAEASQETSKMFADRVRQAGKVGGSKPGAAASNNVVNWNDLK